MEVDIISSLDHIVSNKSQNSLYLSDSENSTRTPEESQKTISFICYNKKIEEETHTFTFEEWNNYLQTVDSIHVLQCLKCKRIIKKDEFIKNGTFIYKSGEKIIERANYVNNKLDGLYERFYLNGIHYERSNYKNGILHGVCEFWYDITGTKMKSMNFENGKLHGPYKYWNQDGKLVEDFYFNYGIRSDILVKIPSKNIVEKPDLDNKTNNIEEIEKEENIEHIFDLSKKKKKEKKEGKHVKKEKKDRNNSDSDNSDLEMEKI